MPAFFFGDDGGGIVCSGSLGGGEGGYLNGNVGGKVSELVDDGGLGGSDMINDDGGLQRVWAHDDCGLGRGSVGDDS